MSFRSRSSFLLAWQARTALALSVSVLLVVSATGIAATGIAARAVAQDFRSVPGVIGATDSTVVESFTGTQKIIIGTAPGKTQTLVNKLAAMGVGVTQKYNTVLDGVAVTVTQQQLEEIRATVALTNILPDSTATLFDTDTQSDAPWNLDRSDQQSFTPSGGARSFTYPESAGAGVTVFVVDSGFTRQNGELDGRVGAGKDFAGGDHGTPSDVSDDSSVRDCNGHGTHVAGTVASTTYGVAKLATIIPVRVFGCGSTTSSSSIIAGIEWAVENKPSSGPSVMNLSLGTAGGNALLDAATQAAIDAGITVVVAAGNGGADGFGDDACFGSTNSMGTYENGTSPARVVDAITVGATGHKNSADPYPKGFLEDLESLYSNYGPCVDLLAPGTGVSSLDYLSSDARILQGTSMAAPLVAGAAALYLGANPFASPVDVQLSLVANAVTGKITPANEFWPAYVSGYPIVRANPTPNLLLNTEFLNSQDGVPGAPSNLTSSAESPTSIVLTWSTPQALNGGTVFDYAIAYRNAATSQWSRFAHGVSATTGITVTGLSALAEYEFQVAALTFQGMGAFSETSSNGSGRTTMPRTLATGAATVSSVALTWSPPSTLNGGAVSDYRVQFKAQGSSTWSTFVDPVSTITGTTVSGLAANTNYQFQVSALTAQADSSYSLTVSKATLSGITSAPRSLAARTATTTRIPLTWITPLTLNGGTISDYRVQYRATGSARWLTFGDAVSDTPGATVSGLLANKSYQFQVSAKTRQGYSAPSAVITKSTRVS